MNKIIYFLTAFVLMWGAPHANAAEEIACEIKHNLHHGNMEIRSFYQLIMKNSSGVMLINGEARDDQENYVISREIHFAYQKRSGNNYQLISGVIHKNPIDNMPEALFKAHYPSFFSDKGSTLTFNIKQDNNKNYIVSFVSTPLFYCNKK